MRHFLYFLSKNMLCITFSFKMRSPKRPLLSTALLQNYACKLIWCMPNLCNFYEICQFIIVPNAFLLQVLIDMPSNKKEQKKSIKNPPNETIKSREIFGKNPQSSSIWVSPPTVMKIWENVTHHDSLGLDHHLNAMNEGLWMTFWSDSVDGNFDGSDINFTTLFRP